MYANGRMPESFIVLQEEKAEIAIKWRCEKNGYRGYVNCGSDAKKMEDENDGETIYRKRFTRSEKDERVLRLTPCRYTKEMTIKAHCEICQGHIDSPQHFH